MSREESGATGQIVSKNSSPSHAPFVRQRHHGAMRKCVLLAWALPLVIHSGDELAWGLYTHVYFAQLLLWAIPLADPRFRRAVRRFPELLLAGACLPDTALFCRYARAEALAITHQWSAAQRMVDAAQDDESRAIAAGYA